MSSVVDVTLRQLPRLQREQLLLTMLNNDDITFSRSGMAVCATLNGVDESHEAWWCALACGSRRREPTCTLLRSPSPARQLARSPSPRRGNQRTVQWASRLVEELMTAACLCDAAVHLPVTDFAAKQLETRRGLPELVRELTADLVSACGRFRGISPECKLFDDARIERISMQVFCGASRVRRLVLPASVQQAQRVSRDDGCHVVARRYIPLERLPEIVKEVVRRDPPTVATSVKRVLVKWIDAYQHSGEHAFDLADHVDVIEFCRQVAGQRCGASARNAASRSSYTGEDVETESLPAHLAHECGVSPGAHSRAAPQGARQDDEDDIVRDICASLAIHAPTSAGVSTSTPLERLAAW